MAFRQDCLAVYCSEAAKMRPLVATIRHQNIPVCCDLKISKYMLATVGGGCRRAAELRSRARMPCPTSHLSRRAAAPIYLVEMAQRKRKYTLRGRDAGSGRFISVSRARKRKRTAVVERIRVRPRKKR